MVYPYNAILGRGAINVFEAVIHGLYLCMKIPRPCGIITVFRDQQVAHNIEIDFVLGQRNVHCLGTNAQNSSSGVSQGRQAVKPYPK
jgi:hypothetical protein